MENPIWHPYTPLSKQKDPILIVKGKGAYIYSEKNIAYLDAISSWWVNLHGHTHPYIRKKIAEQLKCLEHVIFAGFTHEPALKLSTQLLSFFPSHAKVFFSDNGSTSIEVAIKLALQYWDNKKIKKKKVVSFRGGYHGDTFGAMSTASKNRFNKPFWSQLFETLLIDPPFFKREDKSYKQLEALFKHHDVACFIFEPLILGVGGMKIYPKEGLEPLLRLCQKHSVLTIGDEVMTGFGRTGTLFASDQLETKPDFLCLSKGLTGGFLPLGATLCKEFVYRSFSSNTFLHGHSFTGNPLACVSALASLDLLLQEQSFHARKRIEKSHKEFCLKAKNHPHFQRCESLGTILAIEYKDKRKSNYFHPLKEKLSSFFLKKEILLRPLGNVIYVMPPYCIKNKELQRIYDATLSFSQ